MKFEEIEKILPKEIKKYLDMCSITPQSPDWHPEAPNDIIPHNVYKHIKIVYNRAFNHDNNDIDMLVSVLFHDLGKVDVTKPSIKKVGGWSAYGHEEVSAKLVEKHKDWIQSIGSNWNNVFQIVKEHMRIKNFEEMRKPKQNELKNNPLFDKFILFTEFDNMQTLTDYEKFIK